MNARQAAFEVLHSVEKRGAYANLQLSGVIERNKLSPVDAALASAIVRGVTERKYTLDYNISLYLKQSIKRLKIEPLTALRIGAFQLFFMNSIPESAAVNESVKLAKKHCAYCSGMVNAVLRKIAQNGLQLPKREKKSEFLSNAYSCDESIAKLLIGQYGFEKAENVLAESLVTRKTFIRVNTLLTDSVKLKNALLEEGVEAHETKTESCLEVLFRHRAVDRLQSFQSGLFHVQGEASQLAALALKPQKGDTVLDLCSAPGGKAFTLAQLMENEGQILAFDKAESRVRLISNGAKRLKIDIIKTESADGTVFNSKFEKIADKVLVDAPCSGLGVMGNKSEIKYKNAAEFVDLPFIQLNILKNAARYLKPGGRLVYSTCTLNKAENEDVVNTFLSENDDFSLDGCMVTILPEGGADGFFFAAMNKQA